MFLILGIIAAFLILLVLLTVSLSVALILLAINYYRVVAE